MKMSLDESMIPKLSESSRKFKPEKQRKTMNDPFVEKITRTRTDKGETVSGRMVETRSQKSTEEQKSMLEVEVHTDQAMHENQEILGPEGRGNRRLASESTPPVEQGQDFATSTGTLDERRCWNCTTSLLKLWQLEGPHRQHYDGRRKGETGNVRIVFRKSEELFLETSFHLSWERVQAMKVNPRRTKRTMTSKLTLDLESASIVRPRRMRHTPTERLEPWTNLV